MRKRRLSVMLRNADYLQVSMSNKGHWALNLKRFRLMPFFISVKSLIPLLIWVFQRKLKQRLLIFLLKSAMYSLSQDRSKYSGPPRSAIRFVGRRSIHGLVSLLTPVAKAMERSVMRRGNHRILARKRQFKVCYCLR